LAKLKIDELIKILSNDVLKYSTCIEMNFCIENDEVYSDCWLGKLSDKTKGNIEIYWYGLVSDGSQAFEYTELKDILNANVFYSKSICDVIENIDWYSLDGCGVEERLSYYTDNDMTQPRRSVPKSI
jgi:hypothetical protein